MNDATRERLLALNRRFYARHAGSFSESRRRPWDGWKRLLTHLPPHLGHSPHLSPTRGTLRVLDLGCGNGRFGLFLRERFEAIEYQGFDSSTELLEQARRRLASLLEARFANLDLVEDDLSGRLGSRRYHLIVLFGVLHHIPGRSNRIHLLARLAPHLERGGILAASLWRFDRLPRYLGKVLPWESYNERAESPLDLAELERGDHLLTWAGDRETPRYCHLLDEGEAAELVRSSSLPLVERFEADGAGSDNNVYLVLGGV